MRRKEEISWEKEAKTQRSKKVLDMECRCADKQPRNGLFQECYRSWKVPDKCNKLFPSIEACAATQVIK
eukprot:g18038.t1